MPSWFKVLPGDTSDGAARLAAMVGRALRLRWRVEHLYEGPADPLPENDHLRREMERPFGTWDMLARERGLKTDYLRFDEEARRQIAEVVDGRVLKPLCGLLEIAATAHALRRHVYDKIRRGELPGVKVGKYVRVPAAALARHLQQRTRGACATGYTQGQR